MKINPDVVSPCGLYCGVCAIYIGDIVKCCVRRSLGGDPHLFYPVHKADSFDNLC